MDRRRKASYTLPNLVINAAWKINKHNASVDELVLSFELFAKIPGDSISYEYRCLLYLMHNNHHLSVAYTITPCADSRSRYGSSFHSCLR